MLKRGPKLLPASARVMLPTEAAWLAGFFDGEGTHQHDRRGKNGLCCQMTINSTRRPALLYCQEITGIGRVLPQKLMPPQRKRQWRWSVSRQNDVANLLHQMRPYLQIRGVSPHEDYDGR